MTDLTRAIGADDKEMFDDLLAEDGEHSWALMAVAFEGKPTNAIVQVDMDGELFVVTPRYIQVTPEMLERLQNPDGETPQKPGLFVGPAQVQFPPEIFQQ